MSSSEYATGGAGEDEHAAEVADPSSRGGYRVTMAREVPLELRFQTSQEAPQDAGSLEAVQVKVLALGEPPNAVRIELTSESDLFFNYTSTIDERTFRAMRDEQHLMIDFAEFTTVLATNFQNVVTNPQTFIAVFISNQEASGCVLLCVC